VPAVGVEWVRIEPGSFDMGSEEGDEDERPVHRVTISEPFCLGRYEVTQEQWRAVMGPESDPSSFTGDHRPVEGVSWNQVQGFLAALNRRVVGTPFRLPTEAEWEYAARAGTATAYSFGDDPAELYRHGNCLSDDEEDGYDRTAPVGSFAPNPWGLYDLHGNVSEWVADRYGPYPAGPAEDPTGPTTGEERVRRGGSHENSPENCRSATRNHSEPGRHSQTVGFRLAASIDGEPAQ
jgi:formylglycine-generating enzyme required for sulfatase activity